MNNYPVSYTHLDVYKRQGVYIASPDGETAGDGSGIGAAMKPLAYTCFETDRGKFIRFTVPVLYVWALVYIKGK